jgi:hypothetical protein
MRTLYGMIHDDSVSIDEIADFLDRMTEPDRRASVDGLGRGDQRALYRKAAQGAPIDLEHFVPDEIGDGDPVNHLGRNTLPLPPRHRRFQKRFCRPESTGDRLFGYNEAPSRGLIGPGYFVALPTEEVPSWALRGGVVIDYYQVPDGPVVDGWPAVVPNTQGLQRFVYQGTRDFMRRVSSHVSIGAAYKGEKSLDHYFILCRAP